MKVEFRDEYFILVLGVLWVLCFLGPLLRCVGSAVAGLSRCLEAGCGCEECVPCLGVYGQHVLLLALFLQPALLVVAMLASRGNGGSSVWVVRFEPGGVGGVGGAGAWVSGWAGNASNASGAAAGGGVWEARHMVYEVDYLFFALPYAFAVSVSSLLLVHLSKAHLLTAGTLWDDGLEEEVFVYEAAFACELYCFNLSLLASAAAARPVEYLAVTALALTVLELYFVATSRFPRLNAVEHNASAACLLALCVCGGVVWTDIPDYTCALSVLIAGAHVVLSSLLVATHFAAQGAASAQAVVALRLLVAGAACCVHLGVVLLGKKRACAPPAHFSAAS